MANTNKVLNAKKLAAKIRRDIVLMIGAEGHVGHLGGSASSADIVAALYSAKMRHDPKNPNWEGRDKLIYSKGHAAIAQYAALAECGYFPKSELITLKSFGSILQGHPDRNSTPGVEANTGSLGQGLSIAHGMALAAKIDKKDTKVYCILGDGELAEGQIWEAAMAAKFFKVDNLVAILDKNDLQATGACCERFNIDPINEKWKSFGWNVIEIDGHNMKEIFDALEKADKGTDSPTIIIAQTVKGKGFSFAENVVSFHNGALTKEQYQQGLKEIEAVLAKLV